MNPEIIALYFAAVGLIATAYSLYRNYQQSSLEKKLRTLEFTTNQFDLLLQEGAHEALIEKGKINVLEYIGADSKKKRDMLAWIHVLNRIGAALYSKALNEEVVFNVWSPHWFEEKWRTFQPLIAKEKRERGQEASGAYVYFNWLAMVKCPKLRHKYAHKTPK